ncbi:OLC1v1029452C1 [Oldenlandia corymbosa var. corymbosa]|uniref:OLC1v1029452C1 n=1 Tax=Oldenlandia corymbosa var. corymbosa TaxID=529605 RepID=A0AAV1CEK8_OLDCO|nr:OLC1v1029452C1 [Oldenlandia corymbosa var. corymbosa]
MASKAFFIAVAVFATIFAPTMATQFVVGDDKGWTLGVDYAKWAEGKEFHVGDMLMFNYPPGKHNVLKVNGTDFKQCTKPLGAEPLTSGSDMITLAAPGKKWYICGVANHCNQGPMKLVINVWPEGYSPTPAPQPGSAYGITAPSLMIAALVSMIVWIMI